jgi:hypothetical protein
LVCPRDAADGGVVTEQKARARSASMARRLLSPV